MPLLRKVTTHGDSRGVTLPASWLEIIERESGTPLKEVSMDVESFITIKPVLENKKEHQP
jgi:antitoxin component of MazEF toxin-antitoxin module